MSFFRLFSINYAGELSLWNRKAEKLWTVKVDNDMAKCMDVFELGGGTICTHVFL